MKVCAVLLAAGKSERFGQDKLWLPLAGRPLWLASFETLLGCDEVNAVGIVAQPGRADEFRAAAPQAAFVVEGGASRQESSWRGVQAVPEEYDIVLVHDAARPFLDPSLVNRVIDGVKSAGAAFPAIPVTDTIKSSDGDRWVTLDRSRLVAIQTPQGAKLDLMLQAFEGATGEYTDEASLIEAVGQVAIAVQGSQANVKVTHPDDLSRILGPVETRTGLGYDIHAFSHDDGRPLWLGGIEFDDRPGLEGHSDADALLHAIVDALLGAAGLGDIGLRYPNTDPRWKDAPSSLFLKETAELLAAKSFAIRHIDATVIAERPKVMIRRDEICSRIASLVGLPASEVSVKATTNEGLGSLGRAEGIAAFAIATVAHPVPAGLTRRHIG